MKAIKKIFIVLFVSLFIFFIGSKNNVVKAAKVELTIFNCEDYIASDYNRAVSDIVSDEESNVHFLDGKSSNEIIKYLNENDIDYEYDDEEDEVYVDLIGNFELENNCKVNYYTYDTNETMYNQFKLQPDAYDLIVASDYMIQKMVLEGLVEEIDLDEIPNYQEYCSEFLMDKITKSTSVRRLPNGDFENVEEIYAVGYMWGTLGLLYNADFTDTIREDVKSWDILYNTNYENTISIKNSMRDTFVAGLMYSYSKEESFKEIMNNYLSVKNDPTNSNYDRYLNDYQQLIQKIFDFKLDGSEESNNENLEKIQRVKDALIGCKTNIFGLETDSGKSDIVTGKIMVNLAWSGDATYSIDQGREVGSNLEYYVPEDGGNIWFDGWTIPKGGNKELAYKFLDFLSDPDNAADNMDYIGYTPYIVGDSVFDVASSKYGAALFVEGVEYWNGVDGEDIYPANLVIYEDKLYKCIKDTTGEEIPGDSDCFECLEFDPSIEYCEGEMVSCEGKLYYVLEDGKFESIDSFEEVKGYDISYLFEGKLNDGRDGIIYPYYGYANQLECQYPSEYICSRCAIMNDFGSFNEDVIIMWGQFRAYTNMLPIYIILGVFFFVIVGFIVYYSIKTKKHYNFKKNLSKKN